MQPKETPKQEPQNRLIHIARMQSNGQPVYLFLRQRGPRDFRWTEDQGLNQEKDTAITADSIEEALRLGHREWKDRAFRTVICGFRYTLPERDEHGNNALFHQMVASYSSMNGFYFDEELGNNCIVHNASKEARQLMEQLRSEKRI